MKNGLQPGATSWIKNPQLFVTTHKNIRYCTACLKSDSKMWVVCDICNNVVRVHDAKEQDGFFVCGACYEIV